MDKNQIILDISSYMRSWGGLARDWYVGIASDARTRLFIEHRVDENSGKWIYRIAESATEARDIEKHFLDEIGTDGGPGGGDWTAKQIYAYKKTALSKP
jgi:hypothetical protein